MRRKGVTKVLLAFAMLLSVAGSLSVYGQDVNLTAILTQKNLQPSLPMGCFYGYKNAKTGPGDEAFAWCRKLAESNYRPMFLICTESNSSIDDEFTMDVNYWYKDRLNKWFKSCNAVFAYFKSKTPKACQDASAFLDACVKTSGGKIGTVLNYACYWLREGYDEPVIEVGTMSGNPSSANMQAIVNSFLARYKPTVIPKKRNVASARFDCLQSQVLAETMYVPFSRTNCLDRIETNALKIVAGDGSVTNRVFVWQKEQASLEVPVSFASDTNTVWNLILVNTNGYEVATNTVARRTDAVANGFDYPRFIGETNEYQFGEWTMDLAAATNAVAGASGTAYTLAVSGSSTTNAKLQAFKSQVFTNAAFQSWVNDKRVATVVLDRSLLNHTHGSDNSCYLSLKGLRTYEATEPLTNAAERIPPMSAEEMLSQLTLWEEVYRKDVGGEEAEYILLRADGTVAGRLAPQFNADGTCDVDENMARLEELLKEVDDKTEAANNGTATPLTFDWPATTSTTSVNGHTLSVSDTEDRFSLTGEGWSSGKVVLGVAANGTSGTSGTANLHLEVVVNGQVVKPTVEYIVKGNELLCETNYTFNAEDIATNAVFVKAIAYDGAAVTTTKFGGNTRFGYNIKARPIKEATGVVSFVGESDTIVSEETNKTYHVGLVRLLGYSGELSATVLINESLTTATNLYEFADQTVTWTNGESGVKYVDVTLKGTNACDGVKTIVLTNSVTVSGIDEKVVKLYDTFSISYGQEPTDAGEMGICIDESEPAISEDGRIYVRYDETAPALLRTKVYRTGGKGEATGTLTVKSESDGKTVGAQSIVWENYVTGNKTVLWDYEGLPAPSTKTGYADATVKLTSTIDVVEGYDAFRVRVLAKDAPKFSQEAVTWGDAVQYVAFSNAVDVVYGTSGAAGVRALPTGWVVQGATKISGSLPKGLKVSADKATGALIVMGTPTEAGETATSIWWMKFRDAQGDVVMSSPVGLTISVTALAKNEETGKGLIPGFDSARAWTGLPLVNTQTKRLVGLLDMTVAKNGRTTAKWRKAGGKVVTFSASSLSGCVQSEGVTNVFAEAAKTQSKVANEFRVTFWADGTIDGQVSEASGEGAASSEAKFVVPAAKVWSKTNTAEDWEGNYTLAFPHDGSFGFNANTRCYGATSLRVKFTSASQFKTGKTIFAGHLPNGRSVSGTAAFVPASEAAKKAELPIFYSTAADTFGAMVDVLKAGLYPAVAPSETSTNFWQHVESGVAEASYDNDYTVVGARYEADDWEEAWGETYKTNTLNFAIDGEDAGARVAAKGAVLKVTDRGDLKALAFAFNKMSGESRGTFRDSDTIDREPIAEGKTATWSGVVVPDNQMFFMAGAYWYTTEIEYKDANGNAKKRSVRAGGAVSLESAE